MRTFSLHLLAALAVSTLPTTRGRYVSPQSDSAAAAVQPTSLPYQTSLQATPTGGSRKCRRIQDPMQGLAFARHHLRWRLLVEGFSTRLPPAGQRWVLAQAFRRWAEVTPLTFQEDHSSTPNIVDIRLGFGTGRHMGCRWSFDGPGGEYAHTVLPGEIHLDDDDMYSIISAEHGISLLQVALHEIGHVLGLAHLPSPNSVMHSLHLNRRGIVELSREDRNAIQEIYGRCEGRFDTVFDLVSHRSSRHLGEQQIGYNTYFVRGDLYWLYENQQERVRVRDPRSLTLSWPGMPRGGVDAYLHILTSSVDIAYIFKGTQYWRYNRAAWQVYQRDPDRLWYPRSVSEGFDGVTGPVDTAVFYQPHQLIYIFRNRQVWGFNESRHMMEGFPKNLTEVFCPTDSDDHPVGNLDAAYYAHTHRTLFLFKGLFYWEVSHNALLPRRRVADRWRDLCEIHPSSYSNT